MKYMLNDSRVIEGEEGGNKFKEFPAFIEVQTSSICNSKCIVCPYTKVKSYNPRGKMERNLWNKLIDEFMSNRSDIINIEPYLNNEPFLDKDILELLYMLKPIDRYVEISTNLQNCTIEMFDEIIENRLVDEIRCSILGFNRDSYKRIMGIEMRDVLEKLKYLSEANKRAGSPLKIQFTMIGHKTLISDEELREAENYAFVLGVNFKVYPYLDRAENNDLLTEKIISEQKGQVIGCKLGYLRDRIAIWHDGIVVLCCQDWKRKHIIGNLNECSIKELWQSDTIKHYRDNIYFEKNDIQDLICKKCALAIVEEIK